jgi:acyl dehydratase
MPLDLSLAGAPASVTTFDYTWKDVALYALGIGAKRDELDYIYERRGPKVIPSFVVLSKHAPLMTLLAKAGGNLAAVVHGGERVTLHAALEPSGRLVTSASVRGVYDMKRLAQVVIDFRCEDASGRLAAETTSLIFFRGEGGFGGPPPPKDPAPVEKPRDTRPTFQLEESTSPEQALLYRLSGDDNPLHADPQFAKEVGFERGPILHGLCTFGFMVRHVAKALCNGDAARVMAFGATFRRPVWPGETLVTEGWDGGAGLVALEVKVKERAESVITGGWAKIR